MPRSFPSLRHVSNGCPRRKSLSVLRQYKCTSTGIRSDNRLPSRSSPARETCRAPFPHCATFQTAVRAGSPSASCANTNAPARESDRITAYPVDQVPPGRHAALLSLTAPRFKRLSAQEVPQRPAPIQMHQHGNRDQETQAAGQPIVSPLDRSPAVADLALIVVNGNEQLPVRRYQSGRIVEAMPHRAGMVQDSPGVHHVEGAQAAKVTGIQGRAFLYAPIRVLREVPPAQFLGAGYRLWIVIEALHAGSQTARRQTEETDRKS